MNKQLLMGVLVLLASSLVMADTVTMYIYSDESTKWYEPSTNTWSNSSLVTQTHPAWTTEIYAPAKWIWKSDPTNPADEYNYGPTDGRRFQKTFEIPECADPETLTGSILIAADNAFRFSFNGGTEDGLGEMSKDGPDTYTWANTLSLPMNGIVPGTNYLDFRVINYLASGNQTDNPAALIYNGTIEYTLLSDEACYPQEIECTGEEDAPETRLGTNRWTFNEQSGLWETKLPKSGNSPREYSVDDTHGCSCSEILTWLSTEYPDEFGEMEGHWKFGCSISVMDEFIALTSEDN